MFYVCMCGIGVENVTTLEILSIMQAAISTKHLLASFPTSIGGEKHNLGMRLHTTGHLFKHLWMRHHTLLFRAYSWRLVVLM